MLVLTRRAGESIVIGDDIEITVLTVSAGKLRLGITAPAHVQIARAEIIDRDRQPAGRTPSLINGEMACERHPGTAWPHDDCPGPGRPWE